MRATQKAALFVAGLAIVATAACGNRSSSDNDDVAHDLELVPRTGSQTVVSAIEGTPTATPARIARKPAAKPASHPAPLRAAPARTAPAPRVTVVETPRETPSRAQPKTVEPEPLPPAPDAQGAGKARQQGSYGTEAEIFRRMPWIRP